MAEHVIELLNADIPKAQVPMPVALVEGVTWQVRAGEFWAVGAFPGAGKTDLLCTASGLQRPLRGHHLLFGKDATELTDAERIAIRLKVAMVFSAGRLFMNETVEQNIALPLAYHHDLNNDDLRARVEAALELAGIRSLRDRLPTQITRNLHQRVGLARALALEPRVILVDNPLVGIDPRQGRWWLDFLWQLHHGHPKLKEPVTIIIATDDLRPWCDTASQFAFLKEKHLQVIGGREALKTNADEVVRELLNEL